MITKSSSKNNFGWNMKTHKKITEYAIKNSELKLKSHHKKILIDFSAQPDIDETQLHCSSHFCFKIPKDLKPKRFLSFMDFSGQNNALAKVTKHIDKAQKALSKGKMHKAFEEIGRLAHFIGDVCVPLHTEKGSFLTKFFDAKMHIAYETGFVEPNLDKFLRPQTISPLDKKEDFKTLALNLFKENFDFSSQFIISNKNKDSWGEIAQVTMDKAVSSTQKLLEAFCDLAAPKLLDKK